MKTLPRLACVLALLAVGSAASAQGFTVTIPVDENGNGLLTNSNGFSSPLSASQTNDPGPGGLANALTYNLLNPPGLTSGDLLLTDPGTGLLSDVIRFNPNQNGGSLVFYSETGGGSLADIGFPTADYANIFTGIESSTGFVYTPLTGQPGFVTGAAGPVTYVITSDPAAVPEPGSVALLVGMGLSGAGFLARRRKNARQAV